MLSDLHCVLRHLLRLIPALVTLSGIPAAACTIFVLTDENRALFFNNEDWFNPATRIWFVPAGPNHLGCAYLGFDNGWAQGGVNTAGLAFDWVSGFDEQYEADAKLQRVRGNPSERMIESCTTVDEAIAFYRTFLEPDFKRSRILIADRTGASVVIGAQDGRLQFAVRRDNRGFGYARAALERELAKAPEPTIASGAAILRACLQPGDGGTKYSNIFDLKTGGIVLYPFPGREENVQLDLAAELAKGGHYYDLARLRVQSAAPPQPLLNNMKRFYLDGFTPIPDREPLVTAQVRAIIENAAAGRLREADYTPAFWKAIAPAQKEIAADLGKLGRFVSLALVERREDPGGRSYRYLLDFAQARVLGRYVLDGTGQVALMQSEASELKAAAANPP